MCLIGHVVSLWRCSRFIRAPFWEQRNMVKNLCQGACEDATDFMIRVGSSVSNLAKDWKGQITEAKLKSLQYEVSLNRVREEIWHVLDSEIARHGQLTLHQMYEAVKKYKTYAACNKRLVGKSASPHVGHQRTAAQSSGYKPHFHKTTAFVASFKETPDPALSEPLFLKMKIIWEGSQPRKGMKDCTSQASWRRL